MSSLSGSDMARVIGSRLSSELTPTVLRQAFGCFPSGVTAVCGLRNAMPIGMAASSFTSVSLDPALVSVCVARTSTTWPVLRLLPRLGLSVLAEGQDATGRALSAKGVDRFAGLAWESSERGAVVLVGVTAAFECEIQDEIPAGDHEIVVLRVHDVVYEPGIAPLVFHGSTFRQLMPDQSPGADALTVPGAPSATRIR
jgi:flavin reductase (DIM6/NTAB) family NADH-FMN oxidoreductase RutF